MTIADLVIKLGLDDEATKGLDGVAHKIQRGFGKAFVPATAGLAALAVGAHAAVGAASDLAESQNAVNVVFGKSASTIADFAKVADKKAGLSMRQLNELVTPLGASFVNFGDSQDVAAQKSINLAKRAADMASVFNTSVPDALEAIQAGLRGESDPLERFGVKLTASAIASKAMSLGLAKTQSALTAADKAQASYALILDQTNQFQGDFIRTSGGAANSARINAAAQENLKASLGKGLLPAWQSIQHVIGVVTQVMAKHQGVVKVLALTFVALAGFVIAVNAAFKVYRAATIAATAAQWLFNAALAANPIVLVIAAIVALGVALVVLWKKSEKFRAIVTGAWNAIKATTVAVWNALRDFFKKWWPLVLAIFTGGIGLVAVMLVKHWGAIKSTTIAAWNAIVDFFRALPGRILAALASIPGRLGGSARAGVNAFKGAAVAGFANVVSWVAGIPGRIVGALGNVSHLLYAAGAAIIQGLLDGLKSKLDAVTNLAGSIAGKIKSLKGPLPKDRVLLVDEGRAIIGGLIGGMESQLPRLYDMASNLAPTIKAETRIPAQSATASGRSFTLNVNGATLQPLDERELYKLQRRAELLAGVA